VLLALTTLAAMVSLFTFSFVAQEGEFVHALRSGEITSVAVGHSEDFHSDIGFSSTLAHASDDIAVSWVNGFGLRREALLGELMALDQARGGGDGGSGEVGAGEVGAGEVADGAGPSGSSVDPSASIAAKARSLGVVAPEIVRPGELPLDGIGWLPPAVTVLMIAILIFGPQPRRTTKWGALWAYTAPLNLGIFWALLRDSPWNERMNRLPEPSAGDGLAVNQATNDRVVRIDGWSTFFRVCLALNIAISVVLAVIMWVLPDFVDPVAWTAVDLSGNQLPTP
jgi:hypothetical protein